MALAPEVLEEVGEAVRLCNYCRFVTSRKKGTFFSSTLEISGVRCTCRSKQRHLQLRGAQPEGVCGARLAKPNPLGVAEVLGLAAARGAGWRSSRPRLDVEQAAERACSKHRADYNSFRHAGLPRASAGALPTRQKTRRQKAFDFTLGYPGEGPPRQLVL